MKNITATYANGHIAGHQCFTETNTNSCQGLLSGSDFIRIHKSFIVNKRHIDFLEKGRIVIHKNYLPIGEAYKVAVRAKLGI